MLLPRVSKLIKFSTRYLEPGQVLPVSKCLRYHHTRSTPAVKEITIPTPGGDIAAKWWGDENRQPILSLHGWQDNAGSWDKLAPLLPEGFSLLAIDLPGHGRSSWIPKGMLYDNWFFVRIIQDVIRYYKWENVSFLSHSMGSILSFFYSSLYPETVKFYIAVENIVPDVFGSSDKLYNDVAKSLVNFHIDESRIETEPPSYSYDEAIMRWHQGTRRSVSLESAPCLVSRGTRQSKKDSSKYYFCRDPRLKHKIVSPPEPEFIKEGIRRLRCPVLYLKGNESRYATDELSIACRDLLAQTNSKYEYHCIPGTHHIHLNNADAVAQIIAQFLQKHSFTSG